MKRVFFGILILFFISSTIILLVYEEKKEVINYFTLKQNISRLIRDDEGFEVSVFVDEEGSFITDVDSVTSAKISSEMTELSVNVHSIEKVDDNLLFMDKLYNLYSFSLVFNDVAIDSIDLEFLDASLEVNYFNGDKLEFYLGNIWLSFKEIEVNNHLDISNMYAITDVVMEERIIRALVIKFDNFTDRSIIIDEINSNNSFVSFDLGNTVKSMEKIDILTADDLILGDYDHLNAVSDGYISLEDEFYYLIPLSYNNELGKMYRFPLEISYLYQGERFTLVLDDYLFFDEMIRLDDYHDDAVKYQYRYK